MPDGNNLTIDFSDASFDNSSENEQPVPGVDNIDVVFPIDDNPEITLGSGDYAKTGHDFSDNRATSTAPASAIALMPTDAASSAMEEFLFEFDNDLNDDGPGTDQGLKITTSGGSGDQQVVQEINLNGTFENLDTDGSLDVHVSKDPSGNVFEKVTLGEGSDTSGNDNIIFVGGDTNGGDTGAGDDVASINVDASATMGGVFKGGSGYDMIKLVEGVREDNGASVDFTFGINGPNSAFVSNLGGVGDDMSFDIDEFESIQLTDNNDVIFIGSETGASLTDAYDAVYLNGGGTNSMMKVQTGFIDGGMADVMYVHADSNVYLSFEFANESGLGVEATFGANGDVNVDGHIHGSLGDDMGTDGEIIGVSINQSGGAGSMTIDYFEATNNHDMITNLGDIGILVNLGGSDGMADVFTGSETSDNDVLDVRNVDDLVFADPGSGYITINDTVDGTLVNAEVKNVDFIMVRDRVQGPEITQADIDIYDYTKTYLESEVNTADSALYDHNLEQNRLDEISSIKASEAETASSEAETALGNATTHAEGKASLVETTNVTSKALDDHDAEQTRLNNIEATEQNEYESAQTAANNHASGRISLSDAASNASSALSNAVDPNTLIVTGTAGDSGVTDLNEDGVVTLEDIELFMDARLDDDGKNYFAENGYTASLLANSSSSDFATIKPSMIEAGITDSQGFDEFVNDLPILVSQSDLDTYQALVDANQKASDALSSYDTEQTRLDGIVTIKQSEYEAAQTSASDHADGRGTLENNHFYAIKAVTDHNSQQGVLDGIASTKASEAETASSEAETALGNASTHADERDSLVTEKSEAIIALNSFLANNSRPILTDTDFYQDMTHLNGTKLIDGVGQGATDAYGVGYDVVTSAQVDSFAAGSDMRVYYEGKHSDFIDTDDIVNGTEGIFDMSEGKSDRGSNWESEVDSQYGPGQEPGFFIEVSGKKLAVTFDDEKGEWKVDSSAIQVAEDAMITKNLDGMTEGAFAQSVIDRYGLQPASGTSDGDSTGTENSYPDRAASHDGYYYGYGSGSGSYGYGSGSGSYGYGSGSGSYGYGSGSGDNSSGDGFPAVSITGNTADGTISLTVGHNGTYWVLDGSETGDGLAYTNRYYDNIVSLLNDLRNDIGDSYFDELRAMSPNPNDFNNEALKYLSPLRWNDYLSYNTSSGDGSGSGSYGDGSGSGSYGDGSGSGSYGDGSGSGSYGDGSGSGGDTSGGDSLQEANSPAYSFSDDIYLNASEEAITELLATGIVSDKAFNFSFYTKMDVASGDGMVTVNLKLQDNGSNQFSIDAADIDVAVESFYNVAEDAGAGVTSSSAAGEFVKIDNSADIALGNGGDDTYVVGADSGIYGGVALEYGNIGQYGGLTGSIDAVNINSVDSVEDLTFRRGKYRNEEEGNTLFIGDGNGQETVLFDNYNEYLDFRRVEYLTVEDGANNDEIFEIVTNTNLSDWDNEIYVADSDGGVMNVELGGLDYVIGSTKADEFVIDLSDLIGEGKSGTVNLSGIDASDTISVNDYGVLSDADEADLATALSAAVAGVGSTDGEATISFSYSSDKLTLNVDTAMDELDIINREFDHLASS